ncbi:hypothetical protein GCM10010211_25730 [Streptomyces albospinus]|uniref:N-acetyltransferase domain-containing protein n=1 Tax=Streptomyces albospinus TaxID=285515 RepID=A0ABQ2UYK0_9ACTN|nr:GNAT family N-acetyltransferase [Streptomyces albospinus]GGU59638.1 hypothetical protein GCM10010211_25730 [Streptomyces albospinus]
MSEPEIRAARPDERAVVEELFTEASTWLVARGIDQWQYPPRRDLITAALRRGEVLLALRGRRPVGTVQLDGFADPEFRESGDRPESALSAHRMAVGRQAAGEGVGAALPDWAADRAAAAGKAHLRLDAWKDNPGLHRCHRTAGFVPVRVVDLPHRRSGAAFQRAA